MSDDSTKRFTPEQLARLQAMVQEGGPEITITLRSHDLERLHVVAEGLEAAGRLGPGAGRAEAVAAVFAAGLDALEAQLVEELSEALDDDVLLLDDELDDGLDDGREGT